MKQHSKFLSIFLLGVITIYFGLFAGCVMDGPFFRSRGKTTLVSYVSEDFPEACSQQIASDIVERLQSGYPPGQTSLYLTVYLAGHGKGAIALAVEDLLRTKGFTILPEPQDDAVTVAWRIDQLDEQTWYLMVNLSSGYRFSRLYTYNGTTLTPQGSLSQGMF
jgi:hypothetical protein